LGVAVRKGTVYIFFIFKINIELPNGYIVPRTMSLQSVYVFPNLEKVDTAPQTQPSSEKLSKFCITDVMACEVVSSKTIYLAEDVRHSDLTEFQELVM
jgi:hypothetical protein